MAFVGGGEEGGFRDGGREVDWVGLLLSGSGLFDVLGFELVDPEGGEGEAKVGR